MTQGALPQELELLKAEGNTLYAQGSFLPAIEKYSVAIEKVQDNAILYANRAACYISLKKYQEAKKDATKATKLDADYAKGWGRLAAAEEGLQNASAATAGYSRAISCLDKATSLSDATRKLKQLYKSRLKDCKQSNPCIYVAAPAGSKRPWDLAKELPTQPCNSSVWVILGASDNFKNGLTKIDNLNVQNGVAYGITGGIAEITSALIMDDRCFYMTDLADFISRYNKYACFEAKRTQAWIDTLDPKEVIRLAKQRLAQTSDWDQVRPALCVTIRTWLMRGFLARLVGESWEDAHRWYERVASTIEMGRREWPNVSSDLLGVTFVRTFLRGVRRLHLDLYLEALNETAHVSSSCFSCNDLLEMAEAMLVEVEQDIPKEYSPGFTSAFYPYCRGTALSCKASCHLTLANSATSDEEIEDHLKKSAQFYLEAAEMYPEDDESHACFLYQALGIFFKCGTPARETFALIERIRLALPKMQKIWKNSANGLSGVIEPLEELSEIEKTLRKKVEEGKYTLDDKIDMTSES